MKKLSKIGLYLLAAGAVMGTMIPAQGATPDEMERARTIAAQVYIRYNDDAATYLDGKKPVSINELRTLVGDNAKDKELLNNFLKAPVSNDYDKWDQQKMADYWSGEFFSNSGLSNNAADTRNRRIRARLLTMPVTAPQAAPEQPEVQQPVQQEQPSEDLGAHPQEVTLGTPTNMPAVEMDTTSVTEETIKETRDESSSNTWIYIVALIVLVAIVIALVVYAMKSMRNQNGGSNSGMRNNATPQPTNYSQESYEYERRTAAVNNAEMQDMRRRIDDLVRAEKEARTQSEMLAERIGMLQLEVKRLTEENTVLRAANRRPAMPAPEPRMVQPKAAPSSPTSYSLEEEVVAVTAPGVPKKYSESVKLHVGPSDRVIFLGRANRNKIFVRADKQLVEGKSIYRLVTGNGVTGSFIVDTDPAVMGWVGVDPETALYGAVEVATFSTANGATRVVTDAAGTAIFEDGCWKVLHPAAAHFE